MERLSSAAMDEILGQKFPVLDDGFVRVVDYMGGDQSVVRAARISYGEGTKKVSEDRGLIRYLMRHQHGTPFEMPAITLHVRVPMDCWRQWIRHRTAKVNEYSTRYSEAIEAAQRTKPDAWRLQGKGNKQGSFGFLPEGAQEGFGPSGMELSNREYVLQDLAREVYQERLSAGVAREQARKDLPLSTYTEAIWTIDLRNMLHFLGLRMDNHAQQEIRDYATVIGEQIVARWVPLTWEAFNDYHPMRGAQTFTRMELAMLVAEDDPVVQIKYAKEAGWLEVNKKRTGLKRNRERQECEEKFNMIGHVLAWEDPALLEGILEDA
jgi:thymidylate synthase (FAD)